MTPCLSDVKLMLSFFYFYKYCNCRKSCISPLLQCSRNTHCTKIDVSFYDFCMKTDNPRLTSCGMVAVPFSLKSHLFFAYYLFFILYYCFLISNFHLLPTKAKEIYGRLHLQLFTIIYFLFLLLLILYLAIGKVQSI